MLLLTGYQRNFLNQAVPRVLAEVPCFKDIEFLTYTNFPDNLSEENKKGLIGYRQSFLIYAFVELTGTLFFISNSLFNDDTFGARETKRGWEKKEQKDKLMDKYIEFCQAYGKTFRI